MQVKAHYGESPEGLVRRFMKKVKKAGIIEEIHERRRFKKPSVKEKEKEARRKRTLEKLKEERQQK